MAGNLVVRAAGFGANVSYLLARLLRPSTTAADKMAADLLFSMKVENSHPVTWKIFKNVVNVE